MSRERILTLIGLLTALAPFLGFPYSWLMFILPVLGVLVALIALSLPRRRHVAPAV
jgi:TRAP-type C4-dicarboxylate transport system permease small subunit